MLQNYKNILFLSGLFLLLSGCSSKSYHDEMMQKAKDSLNKEEYKDLNESYSSSLVDENFKSKEFISILEDKSLSDILKEMEIIDGNFYYLKSSDIF